MPLTDRMQRYYNFDLRTAVKASKKKKKRSYLWNVSSKKVLFIGLVLTAWNSAEEQCRKSILECIKIKDFFVCAARDPLKRILFERVWDFTLNHCCRKRNKTNPTQGKSLIMTFSTILWLRQMSYFSIITSAKTAEQSHMHAVYV